MSGLEVRWRNKGKKNVTHKTVNGDVAIERTIYWNPQHGTAVPMDDWLGIAQDRYSVGVREMCCRACLRAAFAPASEDLARTAQVTISDSALRDLVGRQGRRAHEDIQAGRYGPDWTSAHCTDKTLITGADGVLVPLVTETQKAKRRATQAKNRQAKGRV